MPNPPSEHDLPWYSDPDYDRSGRLITQDDLDDEYRYKHRYSFELKEEEEEGEDDEFD
jgi:hypothetical protein